MTEKPLLTASLNSIVITRPPALCVSGSISKVSNVGAVLIKHIPFPKRHPDPSLSSALHALILSGIFRTIGIVSLALTSE